jgi:hypothetical protein
MPSTPTYGLPWPLGTATPDAPRDLQALAEATDAALGSHLTAHARGSITSQQVPFGADTILTSTLSSSAVVTKTGNNYNLLKAGYWVVGMRLQFTAIAASQRAFIGIKVPGGVYRSSIIPSEDQQGITAVMYSTGTDNTTFRFFHTNPSPNTVVGDFTIKYVGA